MKAKNVYIISIIGLLMVISGCTRMDEFYKEYIKDGETIYSVKVEKPVVFPGDERIKLKGYLKNALQVKTISLKWLNEDNTESIKTFPYDYTQSPDSFMVELPLAEGQYLFSVTSENSEGNQSIPTDVFFRVYGDKYRRILENRAITEIAPHNTGGIKMQFASAPDNHTGSYFEYQNKSGDSKYILILPSESQIFVNDIDLSLPALFRSGYLPEPNAIDTFYAETAVLDLSPLANIIFEFDKSLWQIIDFSSQEDPAVEGGGNGPAANIIDGNISSYWQSRWSGEVAQLPHHITIDMQNEFNVFEIELYRRSGNNHLKKVILGMHLFKKNRLS
jgi:hypothetical protein